MSYVPYVFIGTACASIVAPFIFHKFNRFIPERNEVLLAKINKTCAEDVLESQNTNSINDEKVAAIESFVIDDVSNEVCFEICHMSEMDYNLQVLEHNRQIASKLNPNYDVKMFTKCDIEFPDPFHDMNCDVTFTIKKKT